MRTSRTFACRLPPRREVFIGYEEAEDDGWNALSSSLDQFEDLLSPARSEQYGPAMSALDTAIQLSLQAFEEWWFRGYADPNPPRAMDALHGFQRICVDVYRIAHAGWNPGGEEEAV